MRKFSILLSVLVLAAMVLAACGGEETSTSIPTDNVPPVTIEVTGTSIGTATEVPTEGTATEVAGTPGVPVTGQTNPASLSNEITFSVMNQDGDQIGQVSDMVLDLDNTRVAYVVVNTSGFGDLGDRNILVPWDSLQLQMGDSTSGQANAFILQTNQDTFNNAPDFDLSSLPSMGQPANDWDADISSYWQNGGTSGGTGTGTGAATATTTTGSSGTGLATATSSTGGTGTGLATATSETGSGTGTGLATATSETGTGTGTATGMTALQGVVLATDILGSTVTLGAQGTGTGTGTGLATATTGTGTGGTDLATATSTTGTGGTGLATATSSAGGTDLATATSTTGSGLATAVPGTGTGSTVATVEDMILDTTTGDIQYIVLNTNGGTDQLIPVPLSMFQWDNSAQGLMLNADSTMLQNAPSFSSNAFPDTTMSDWNSEFDTYWQSNGSGGSGTGTGAATETPTP